MRDWPDLNASKPPRLHLVVPANPPYNKAASQSSQSTSDLRPPTSDLRPPTSDLSPLL
jgi:hypothetical protein